MVTMAENLKGHLILLMAPSGSGKSVLLKFLRETGLPLKFAVSCTTRMKRPGEVDGEIYHFISESEFETYRERGLFLETASYSNSNYGTLRSEILAPMKAGEVVIREVELQGIQAILELLPRECVTIVYIDGGDWEQLKRRIISRAPITDAELALRYERYLKENAARSLADTEIKNGEGEMDQAKIKLRQLVERIINQVENKQ